MFITMRTRKSLWDVRQFEEAAPENRFSVLGAHDVGDRRPRNVEADRDAAMFGEPTLDGTAREIEAAIEAMRNAAAR